MGTSFPGVRGHGPPEGRGMPPVVRRTSDIFPWSLHSDGPLSSRPQPLGSGGDAAPCEDTREDFGLSFFIFLPPRFVVGWLSSVRPMRAKRSQVRSTSGNPGVVKGAIWRFKAACHVVTQPCHKGESDVAVAAGWRFHPMTQAHGCKKQRSGVTTQDKRAPPARATNPRTGGHRPKKTTPHDRYPVVYFFDPAGVLKLESLVSFSVLALVVQWLVVVLVFDESVFEFVVLVRRPARYFFLSPPAYWVAPPGCSAWVDLPGSWFFTPGSCLLAVRVFAVSSSMFTCPQISSTVLVTVLPSSSSLLLTMFCLRSCRFRALCLLRVFPSSTSWILTAQSEHISFSMPRRASQDVTFDVCD